MKKIIATTAILTLLTVSCKKNEPIATVNETVKTQGLQIVQDSTKMNWIAYKTTAKTPVKGTFTEISLKNTQTGSAPEAVLEGATFSIPVRSLFTKDASRDNTLKQFFFKVLNDTEIIGGTFSFANGKPIIILSFNGITKQIEAVTAFENKKFTVNAVLNLNDFGAQNAVASLSTACFDLHKGADGVIKTWSEVAVEGSVVFE